MWKQLIFIFFLTISNAAAQSALVVPGAGRCQAGTVYRIESLGELHNPKLRPQLDCIFAAGVVPTRIPYGALKIAVLEVFNSYLLSVPSDLNFYGNYVTRAPCPTNPNDTVSIMWKNVNGMPEMTAVVSCGIAGEPKERAVPNENHNERNTLMFNYVDDKLAHCRLLEQRANLNARDRIKLNNGPFTRCFDLVRLVGVQESDGGRIYLGRSYMRSPNRSGGAIPFAYISILNYDRDVNPNFLRGQPLPVLTISSTEFELGRLIGRSAVGAAERIRERRNRRRYLSRRCRRLGEHMRLHCVKQETLPYWNTLISEQRLDRLNRIRTGSNFQRVPIYTYPDSSSQNSRN